MRCSMGRTSRSVMQTGLQRLPGADKDSRPQTIRKESGVTVAVCRGWSRFAEPEARRKARRAGGPVRSVRLDDVLGARRRRHR
jgi:hypothetical protein